MTRQPSARHGVPQPECGGERLPIWPNAWCNVFALRPRLALAVIAAWNTSRYAASVTSRRAFPAAATIRPAAR